MKVLNVETETRTANVLIGASVYLTDREMRFIVGANRRLAVLNHEMYEALNTNNLSGSEKNKLHEQIGDITNKLAMVMAPKLEEALLVIDNQFINDFDPYQEDREVGITNEQAEAITTKFKGRKNENSYL